MRPRPAPDGMVSSHLWHRDTILVPWDPLQIKIKGPIRHFYLKNPVKAPNSHLSPQGLELLSEFIKTSREQFHFHMIYMETNQARSGHSNLSFSSFTIPFHCYNEIWSIACNNACKEGHCHQGLTQNTRCQRQHHRKPSGQSIQFYTTTSTPISETIQQVVKRTIILSNNEGKPIWSAGSVWHFETLVWRQCPSHQHSIQSNTAS